MKMKGKKKIIFLILAIVIIGLGVYKYSGLANPKMVYTSQIATKSNLNLSYDVSGKVQAKKIVTVFSNNEATVEKVNFREGEQVKKGDMVFVMPYIDKTNRLCATMRIGNHLTTTHHYKTGDEVTATVYQIHDEIGIFVAVDNCYHGLLPKRDVFEKYQLGQTIVGRITRVHNDGKLNIATKAKVGVQIHDDVDVLRAALVDADGFLPYNDKTEPETIKQVFKMSKRAFKRAIGVLLKAGEIDILADGIKAKKN